MNVNFLKSIIGNYVFKLEATLISDKKKTEDKYRKIYKKNIDWDNLETFTDKLLYLKLHYRNPLMTLCSDKAYAGEYVSACGYPEILRKIYGIYNDANKIDIDLMPDEFFVRCNHMSGFNFRVIKGSDNFSKIQKQLNALLRRNFYYQSREWNYKNIEPRVICEEYLTNSDKSPLVDYKFFCFGGKPVYFSVILGEFDHRIRNHKFDMNKKSIDNFFKKEPTLKESEVVLPENIDEMIEIVSDLCKPFPHVRVDLYNIDGRIVFGEFTFFSSSGFVNIYSEEYNKKLGKLIDLKKYNKDMI